MKIFFLVLCLLPTLVCAQKLSLEPVVSYRIINAESTTIRADSISAYDNYPDDKAISFGLKVDYAFNEIIRLSSGMEYYSFGRTYLLYNDQVCDYCPVLKGGGVFYRTLVFPQQLHLRLGKKGKWSFFGLGGVVPVVNINKTHQKVQADGNYLSQGVADVINALPATVKPFYMDYTVGAKVSYWRLHLYLQLQSNLSRATNKPLAIWGNTYNFRRREAQLAATISYTLIGN